MGPAVEALVDAYARLRLKGESFNAAYARLGVQPFKDAVYGPADPA